MIAVVVAVVGRSLIVVSSRGHRDTVAGNIAVGHHASLRDKIPVPPDKHAVGIVDSQTKMDTLVILKGDIGVRCSNSFGLSAGEPLVRKSGNLMISNYFRCPG